MIDEKILRTDSVEDLVNRFVDLSLKMERAEKTNRIARRNLIFNDQLLVEKELKSRAGDQRGALLALYGYPNMHVRLRAAKATVSVAPQAARQALERISESQWPEAGSAGMALWAWDEGIWKPD
jgi:hypothetical protein